MLENIFFRCKNHRKLKHYGLEISIVFQLFRIRNNRKWRVIDLPFVSNREAGSKPASRCTTKFTPLKMNLCKSV